MKGHFDQVIPEEIQGNETLIAVYTDLRHLYELMSIRTGYQADNSGRLERVLMVGYTRYLTVREREVVKRLCRVAKSIRLNELFTAGEWQGLPRKIDSLFSALTPEEEVMLRRFAGQLVQDAFSPQWSGTERVISSWLRIESLTKQGEEEESDGRHALIPTVYAHTYQPWLGKRKPTSVEPGPTNGHFVVVLPGMKKIHQLVFINRNRNRKENYLISLQRLVHETLGRPVASKIVIGSLYLHQRHVRDGGHPNDFITVGVDEMARLIGTGALNKNRTIDSEFQSLFSRTFFLLSMARLVWVPDPWTPNTGNLDWIRSPLYHIGYEGGVGDEWADASIISYRLGDLFTDTLYRSGRFNGAVAPLDLDLYFSWHSQWEAEEQCLHLYYTQMFQMNLENGGTYQATVGEIMDNAGLTLPDSRHTGERYDRFLKAHDTLQKKNVIGKYTIDDPSAPFMERTITVEPSDALLRRLRETARNPSPFMLQP